MSKKFEIEGVPFEPLDMSDSEAKRTAGDILALAMAEYVGKSLRVDESNRVLLQMDNGTEKEVYLDANKKLALR